MPARRVTPFFVDCIDNGLGRLYCSLWQLVANGGRSVKRAGLPLYLIIVFFEIEDRRHAAR